MYEYAHASDSEILWAGVEFVELPSLDNPASGSASPSAASAEDHLAFDHSPPPAGLGKTISNAEHTAALWVTH